MKVWIFSVVVHLLLFVALMWVRFVPEQKIAESVVINTYSYTQVRPKPAPLAVAKQIAAEKIPQQSVEPAKPPAKVAAKVAMSPGSNRKAANAVAETPKNIGQKSQPADGPSSLAERALASAAAMASASSAPDRSMQQELPGSGRHNNSELTPALLKEVKRYTDGSVLVKGVHGCWKVPPSESRNGAIWLTTSTPCKADTTAEQIDAILEKRRGYSRD